jgi:A/G-specific adenine glycosylase
LTLLLEDPQGRILLQEQGEKGLWRKLWMPPFVQLESSNEAIFESANRWLGLVMGLSPSNLTSICKQADQQDWIVHELTHRKMHFKILHFKWEDEPALAHALTTGAMGFYLPREKPLPRLVGKLLENVAQRDATSELGASIQGSVPDQDAFDFV